MNWLETQEVERARLKSAIWDDDDFLVWVEDRGVDEALRDVMEFRWSLTEQLRARRADLTADPDWDKRTTRLTIRLNQRKAQLGRLIRATKGDEYFADLRDEIREDNDVD